MFVLLSSKPPFDGENDDQIKKSIKKGKLLYEGTLASPEWKKISKLTKDFIRDKLLIADPDVRISAPEFLDHPWMKNNTKIRT